MPRFTIGVFVGMWLFYEYGAWLTETFNRVTGSIGGV